MIESQLNIKRMPPAWLIVILNIIRNGLIGLSRRLMPPSVVVLEMAQQFIISKAIGMASDLNLADHLLDSPKTADEPRQDAQRNRRVHVDLPCLERSPGRLVERQSRIEHGGDGQQQAEPAQQLCGSEFHALRGAGIERHRQHHYLPGRNAGHGQAADVELALYLAALLLLLDYLQHREGGR